MNVSDVMTPVSLTGTPTDALRSAAERMWSQQTGSLVVVEADRLAGIITERDVLRAVARGVDPHSTPVKDVMTVDVRAVAPDTPLREAAHEMARHWIRHLPVVDGSGALAGLLSQRDVTGIFAGLTEEPGEGDFQLGQLVRERRLIRIEQGDLD